MQAGGFEDELGVKFNAWKMKEKGNEYMGAEWLILVNGHIKQSGKGVDEVFAAMLKYNAGHKWDAESKTWSEETKKSDKHPTIAIFNYTNPDVERNKILAFGFCDDCVTYGKLKDGRKMKHASRLQGLCGICQGIKGNTVKAYASESQLVEDSLKTWFMENDRV